MEYRTVEFAIFGVLGFLFWAVGYFNLFKKAEIYLPYKGIPSISLWRGINFILGTVAWLLLTFALMGPREPAGFIKGKTEANDIFLVVDTSASMLAQDFQPNRLAVAKNKIREFVALRPTDRIGIIMFGEKVLTLLPLSTDINLINKMVEGIRAGRLGSGTNIGDALGLAVGRASHSQAKNKVIILLTDGVANIGTMTPMQAAESAKEQNVKIYTIGIGHVKNKKVLYRGGRYQNIPGGSVDLKTLDMIAKTTGAQSFFAQDAGALRRVFDDIQKLEKTGIEVSGRVVYKEKYLFYLISGVLLLLISDLSRRMFLREAW